MDTMTAATRVVAPGTTRLELTDGDYLIVKTRLNAGETLDLFERAAPDVDITAPGALAHLSPARVGLGIVVAYLLDWSFTDEAGQPMALRAASADDKEAMLRILDFDSLVEIMNAITAHDAAIRQEKKRRAAARAS